MHRLPTLFTIPRRGLGAMLLIALLGAGCGGRKGEVSGSISYQGKPLTVGSITFLDAHEQAVGSAAITKGKYVITKVPTGLVKIVVTTPPPLPNKEPKIAKKMIEAKEKLIKEKGLDQEQRMEAKRRSIPRPVPHVSIPAKYGHPDQSELTYTVQPGAQQHDINLN